MKIGIKQKTIALLLCSITLQVAEMPAGMISQPHSYSLQDRCIAGFGLGFAAASAYCFLKSSNRHVTEIRRRLRRLARNTINATISVRARLNGISPLQAAAGRGYGRIVRLLVGACGSKDHENRALIKAAQNGHKNAVLALLEHNTDNLKQTSLYCTAGNIAAPDCHAHIAWMLTDNSARNLKAESLINAVRTGDTNTTRILLATGADARVQDSDGKRPLHLAAMRGDAGMIQMMFDHGALVDDQDDNGKTALHLAVCNNRVDIVRKLLERGANADAQASGLTALQIATDNGHKDIIRVLKAHMIPDTRSEEQKLLHGGHSIPELLEILDDQDREDPISYKAISINDLSSFVVLPTTPNTIISLETAHDAINRFNSQDPFNRQPIPDWFIERLPVLVCSDQRHMETWLRYLRYNPQRR